MGIVKNESILRDRYQNRLDHFCLPGEGRHSALLGVANLGVMAGSSLVQIHEDLRNATDMPDSEIKQALEKAAREHGLGSAVYIPPKPKPVVREGEAALRRIIEQATITDEADLWEVSPIRLMDEPVKDAALFVKLKAQTLSRRKAENHQL
jgi:hypothetical protein